MTNPHIKKSTQRVLTFLIPALLVLGIGVAYAAGTYGFAEDSSGVIGGYTYNNTDPYNTTSSTVPDGGTPNNGFWETSASPVANVNINGSTYANTYEPSMATSSSGGSILVNYGQFDGTDSNGNTVCDNIATGAGLSKSTQYYCTLRVDYTYYYVCVGGLSGGGACEGGSGSLGGTIDNAFIEIFTVKPTGYNTYQPGLNGCGAADYGETSSCELLDSTSVATPTVTLSANPTTIVSGNDSALTWSSTNATSCTGTGFSTSNATTSTVSVAPTTTTTYSVSCTGSGGTSPTSNATVTVTAAGSLTAACTVSPTSTSPGSSVTWTATASGGTSTSTPDTYAWTATGGSPSTGSASTLTNSYATPGTYTGSVTVTNGSGSYSLNPLGDWSWYEVQGEAPTNNDCPATCNASNVGQYCYAHYASFNTNLPPSCPTIDAQNNACHVEFDETWQCQGPETVTAICSTNLTVTAPPVTGSCSVSPASATTGTSVTWTAVASGGTGTYTYTWTATGGSPSTGSASTLSTSYASAGTYPASVVITSNGVSSGTINCSNSETASAVAAPDLTVVSAPTPSTATAGTAQAFTGTNAIENIGNATATSFPSQLEIANASDVEIAYATATPATLTLAASATGSVSDSYTFASAGTYNVRWCANMNSGGTTVITESNYGNNCGAWDTVTVAPAPTAPTGTCSVSPASATTGTSVTWTAVPSGGNGTYTYVWTATSGSPSTGTAISLATSYSSAGTYSASVVITSNGLSSGTINCSNSETASAPALPDLTVVSAPTPSTATASSSQTFTGTNAIENIGNATATNFPNVLEVADASDNPIIYVAASPATLTLAASATGSVSANYTFASVGTYNVRWCANENITPTNVITESNYGNNCGAWDTVTVSAAPTAPTGTCSPSSTSIGKGSSATWTAVPAGGNGTYTYSWSAPGGNTPSGFASTLTSVYNTAGTYSATVTITSNGVSSGAITCSNSLTVTGPPTGSCTFSPSSTTTGSPVTWTVTPSGGNGTYTYSWTATGGSPSSGIASSLTNSYASAGNYTATVVITSNGVSSATIGCKGNVVISAPEPDLTVVSAPTPSTASTGVTQTFTGTNAIENTGNATATSFPNVLEVANGGGVEQAYVAATPATLTLAANAYGSVSAGYAFPSSGSYEVRWCANMNTSGTNVITESNYANNCGSWDPVTVTAAPTAPSGSCSVSPTSATTGTSVTWTAVPSGGNGTYTYVWNVPSGSPSTGTTSALSTSYSSAGAYSATVTITSNGLSSGAITCSNFATITAPTLPDITVVSVPTPSTATAGTAQTFTGTNAIENIGTGVGTNFPNELEVANSSDVEQAYVSAGNLTLAQNGYGSVSAAYTFPSAGTYNVRWCGNEDGTGTPVITESNYGNNCGGWDTVTVSNSAPPPSASASCSPSPSSASTGTSILWTPSISGFSGTITYSWSDSNGTPPSGSGSTYTDSYASAGGYSPSLTVSDTNGDHASASCTPVTITSGSGGSCSSSPSGDIVPSETLVGSSNSGITLMYSASGIPQGDTCSISGPGFSTPYVIGPVGSSCSISTSTTPSTGELTTQSIYTLTCSGWSGKDSVVVNVTPQFQEF